MRPATGVFNQQIGVVSDISTTGLLGFWKFNEGSGTAAASTTGTHALTLYGTPTWPTGKTGTGVGLNGTSQYAETVKTTALDITTNTVSIMAWINADTTASVRRILSLPHNNTVGYEHYSLTINAGALELFIGDGNAPESIASTAFTTTGSWVHVAGVYNGTDLRLYINGTQTGTPTSRTTNMQATDQGNLRIGSFSSTFTQYFDGIIDDVRLYNRAVSAAEVATVYSLG